MGDKLLPDAAVKAIQDSVRNEMVTVGGVEYSTLPLHDLRTPDPVIKTLEVNTLTGLVDYLQKASEVEAPIIHVVGHDEVVIFTLAEGRFRRREYPIKAKCETVLGKTFNFGQYYDSESFNVALQSLFVLTDESESVLRVVGNIKEEAVKETGDDGRTQTVTARAGIARIAEVDVPNPVTLQPYRTFREIEQPSSPFILRLRSGSGGQKPTCALFEADGGKWKLTAIGRIKDWLAEKLPEATIIA